MKKKMEDNMNKTLLFFVLLFSVSLAFAAPYGHRYDVEQAWETTSICEGQTLRFSVEWGEGDWTNSQLGYGTSTDGSGWTWVGINWFEDGGGSNKRCRVDVQFNTQGTYYYAYAMEKPASTTTYQHGSDGWSENASSISAYNYVLVEDCPLPVTLSSFNAVYSNGSSMLEWTTQSETNNLGWYIFRSHTNDIGTAIQINDSMIEGAGTTTSPTDYNYSDNTFAIPGFTYFYWLISVDIGGGSHLSTPIGIVIPIDNNGNAPEILEANGIQNYPNPFNPSTILNYKAANLVNAEIIVYNTKGQVIKSFSNLPTTDGKSGSIEWNGTDSSGNPVSSGVYYYKLKAGSEEYLEKMILAK
jgi:hypothetical protein